MRQAIRGARQTPIVVVEQGRTVLRVGGVIQSVGVNDTYQADIWDAMLPRRQPASALILGLGGGTIATLLTQRYGPMPIIGVERDPAVVWLARHDFGMGALEHLRIVTDDAFDYAWRCRETFDAICVDLYTAGKMAHGVLGGSFLRDVARLLTPEGEATVNLWRSPYLEDQLRRIGRELLVRDVVAVDDNVVVHCGRLPSAR
jgi:spermidine synthase